MIKKNTPTKVQTILIFSSILVIFFLVAFTGTAMTASMQAIKVNLNLSNVVMQWLIIGYTIFTASFIVIGGQLGDVFGHANLFRIGVLINISASILLSIGSNTSLVMIGTVLRGISMALIVPNSMALLTIIIPPEKKAKILAIWATVGLFGWGLGPLLGGLFSSANWRLLYWINLALFIIALIILTYYKSKIKTIVLNKPIDIIGSVLLFLGLVTLVLLLSEGPAWGWISPMNISLYAISPTLLILFFYSQTKIARPLIIYRVCKNKIFLTSLICGFCGVACYYCLIYFVNLYFLSVVGQNSSYIFAGIAVTPALMVAAIISIFTKQLIQKLGFKYLISLGCLLIFASMILLLWLPENVSYKYLWWIFLICGIGLGIVFATGAPLCQSSVKPQDSGMASGIFACVGFLGPSVIIPIAASWHTHTEISYITNSFQSLNLSLSHDDIIKISSAMHSNMHILKNTLANFDLSNNQIHTVISDLKESAEIGFGRAGLVSAIFAAIGFVFCLLFAPGKDKNK